MTLTLHVDRARWEANVRSVAEAHGDVVAVVKGNGYGFGRAGLAREAVALGLSRLAVGTVYELVDLPALDVPAVVLTPAGPDDVDGLGTAVATVGSQSHVAALARAGVRRDVEVKLASSMQRYGVEPDELAPVLTAADTAGLDVRGFSLHLPLEADGAQLDAWLARLPNGAPVTVSHLGPEVLAAARRRHPGRAIAARLGTALWHGDKSFLRLAATVVEVRTVEADARAGYRGVSVPGKGTLVMIGAGTAHGVHPLPDGRSPFHYARRRLVLVEPPHMHTSMAWVPAGDPVPDVGSEVDVQQPLTFVTADRIVDD